MIVAALTQWFANRIDPEAPAETPPPRRLWPFIKWALAGGWGPVWLAAAGFGIGGVAEALIMYLLGAVIDATVAAEGAFWASNAWLLAFTALILVVIRPIFFGLATAFQSITMSPNLSAQILIRLNRHTLGQSVSFFDNDFAGRIAQKQLQTATALISVVQETVNAMSFALAAVLGMLVLSGSVAFGMVGLLCLWLAAYALLMWYFLPRIRVRSAARAEARAGVTGQVVDTISNIKTVKLFAHGAHEDRAALNSISNYRAKAIDWAVLAVTFRVFLIVLAGLLPVMMLGYGLFEWQQGGVSSGDLAAVGAMSIRLAQMTGWVSWTLMSIYADLGEVEDGMRTLSPAHDLVDAADAVPLRVQDGGIRFENVRFAYGRATGGVSEVSLTIAPGEKLGIVGGSGAGKSTLVALLMRLYDREAGRILIDGQDIAEVTQDSLRRQIGMVTQETAMFNRSARDNVLYGRPDATDAEILEATRKSEAHDFIEDLEDHKGRKGYDAFLGERGVKLSGGQRQRIALARAILKDAPILILDEATSALDSEVEASIQAALHRVMEGKTVLAIAHRLSTLSEMDRIIVLDQGCIVESGSHEALMHQDGRYAQYWRRQSGGFIQTDAAE